jgi:hypothetical protein
MHWVLERITCRERAPQRPSAQEHPGAHDAPSPRVDPGRRKYAPCIRGRVIHAKLTCRAGAEWNLSEKTWVSQAHSHRAEPGNKTSSLFVTFSCCKFSKPCLHTYRVIVVINYCLQCQCGDKLLTSGAGSSCQHVRHMTLHCIVRRDCVLMFNTIRYCL